MAASTNQAAKWYEQPYYAGLRDRVGPEEYPRPDTFYGWAKDGAGNVSAVGTPATVKIAPAASPPETRAAAFTAFTKGS